jgi:hypothetical protein
MKNVRLRLVPALAIVAAFGASLGCGSNDDEGEDRGAPDTATVSAALKLASIRVSGFLETPGVCNTFAVSAQWKADPSQASIVFELFDAKGNLIVNDRESGGLSSSDDTIPLLSIPFFVVDSTTTNRFELRATLTDGPDGSGTVLATGQKTLRLPCQAPPVP